MGRRIGDRYELVDQIGVGGSARVYSAVDERLGRPVAIKLLDAELAASADPAARDRFLREGPVSASFMHRHAVTIFDAGEDDGELYIAMELVNGQSLAQRLATSGPLDIDVAVRIAQQVLSALEAAHAAGIVHRDVKPANILLAENGDAKLTDFGIAKRFDEMEESVTRTGTAIGTPRYLAPEQAQGDAVSPATDIYAMGVVLFEMLTGRTPFSDSTASGSAGRLEAPPWIARVVRQALEQDPTQRFASATAMATALSSPPTEVIMEPTAVMAARSGDTAVMPLRPRRRAGGRRVPLGLAAVAVVAVASLGARLSMDDGIDELADGSLPVTTPATEPPATEAPTTIPATPPPTTYATDDLGVLLEQLRADPGAVGVAGQELVDSLDRLLGERAKKKQRDRAKDLIEHVDEWTRDGELDPGIGDAVKVLIAPYADK